jgi:hypothetical protein
MMLAALSPAAAQPSGMTIYVGPTTRDGFVDIDRGVRDSINDIKSVIRKRTKLRIVERPSEATLVLEVIRRGAVGSEGMVGVPVGNMGLFWGIKTLAVDTVLRVGEYEKPIVGVEDQWKDCAGQVVNHLKAWLDANQAKLSQ